MSFRLPITKLAWDVYNTYKDAPSQFRNLSNEIKSLHNIVDSDMFKAKSRDGNLTSEERERLWEIVQECTNVLKDLDRLLIKYKGLESQQDSSWQALDRVKWGQEDIAELRLRLILNSSLLNAYITRYVQLLILISVMEYP